MIVVFGMITAIAIVFISVIIYRFYQRTIFLMESANEVVDKVSVIIDYTEREVMQPVLRFGTIMQGIIHSVTFFTDLFKKGR